VWLPDRPCADHVILEAATSPMLWAAALTGVLMGLGVQWDDAHWVQSDMIGTDLWDRSGQGSSERCQ